MNKLGRETESADAARAEPRFAGHHSPDVADERAARKIRERVMAEIDRLNLRKYIGDLEIDGYTILPPEVVGASASFVDELREKTLEVAESDAFNKIDIRPDRVNTDTGPFGQAKFAAFVLHRGRVFEQALMNEPKLAILSYLLGESCRLQSTMAMKKGPGNEYMLLHADNNHSAAPVAFPHICEHANATWILTDYNEENGSTVLVAGSHKLGRAPTSHEARDLTLFKPIEAKAGSILIHHGNVWHGSVPRRAPGYRVSMVETFCRWYGYQHTNIASHLPPEVFERNPPRFKVLTGAKTIDGYGSDQNRIVILSPFG
jgi:ectoine hydroxylase-related dioxygenase (phytanoyl-CoA dioxygenase family)